MSTSIELNTLKGSGRMTESVEKTKNASSTQLKSQGLGEKKTSEEQKHILLLLTPFAKATWFGCLALDAVNKSQLAIMKTTTSLLKLHGFASPATSSGTKS